MSPVLPKKSMTEEDIKLQYITPAVTSKWSIGKITMESQITDGKINLKGNFVFREKPKRADYLLYLSANNPIAVIEAKDNNHSISHGLQQAMEYAKMLDLPFAFSSNGDGFAEHDFLTGTEREFGLDEFPTEAELIARYKKESGLTSAQEIAIDQPYYTSQNTYSWFWESASQGKEYAQFFLDHFNDNHSPNVLLSATKLLHHMGRIFQDNSIPPCPPGSQRADRKLRQ